jgi:PhoH-like ATPase
VLILKNVKFSKIYVLDTNVLLHDPQSIFKFEDNLVIIPIVVLEELDTFKKGQDETARNSRQISRYLDGLRNQGSLSDGVLLDNGGYLKIELTPREGKSVDNTILDIAGIIASENKKSKVAIVSKDINLRIKANAINIEAEDFEGDKVNFEEMYTGVKVFECDGEVINRLYSEKYISEEKDKLDEHIK